MADLEIQLLTLPDGRFQVRIFLTEAPGVAIYTTPIPRSTEDDALRDARAWTWENHPESNFGGLD